MTIKDLNQLAHEALCAKSTMPTYAVPMPKYNDRSANDLTKAIIAYIHLIGGRADRISSAGRYIKQSMGVDQVFNRKLETGKYIPSQTRNGYADINATYKGRSIMIEVKFGKDRQSEAQKLFAELERKAGGIYIVAKTFEQFIKEFSNLLLL